MGNDSDNGNVSNVSSIGSDNTPHNGSNLSSTALITARQAENHLKEQLSLSWTDQRGLINCATALNEAGVRKAVQIAKTYQLPLNLIHMINTKQGMKPYVGADAVMFRLQIDPRGLRSIETEILQWATTEKPEARARATVTFADGSRFVRHASHSSVSENNPSWTPDFITMKCETKAMRRVGKAAVPIPFPVFEDFAEFKEWENRHRDDVVEGQVRESMNMAEFLAEMFKRGYASVEEMAKRVGVDKLEDIVDYKEALNAIDGDDDV